ncbi:MAG: hypothetical protein ACAI38_07045 [Myxococcota bacterium]
MSVNQPNRLHDLARGLQAWSTRPDGYNYQLVDQGFVDRMRSGTPTVADYQHIEAAAKDRARQVGFCPPDSLDPDYGVRLGVARDLEAMRKALAEHPGIKEAIAAAPSKVSQIWAGLRACLPGGR